MLPECSNCYVKNNQDMRQEVSLNICKEQFSVKYMNSGFTFFSVNIEVGIGSSLFFFSINREKNLYDAIQVVYHALQVNLVN